MGEAPFGLVRTRPWGSSSLRRRFAERLSSSVFVLQRC
jgi:hypothetical protein